MARKSGRQNKLTLADAEYIRTHAKRRGVEPTRGHNDMTQRELSEKFDVAPRTIGYVLSNHILVPEGTERAYLRRDVERHEAAMARRAERDQAKTENPPAPKKERAPKKEKAPKKGKAPKKEKAPKRATKSPAERKSKKGGKGRGGKRKGGGIQRKTKADTQESYVERDGEQTLAEAAG